MFGKNTNILFYGITWNLVKPMRGIKMMCTAIEKAQGTPTQLTSIHADLSQVCLLNIIYKLKYIDMQYTRTLLYSSTSYIFK